jgi:aryl-alcohol dehydrogenase-like predicted oxidoreductase
LAAGKAIKDTPREQVIIASKWGPMIDEEFNFTHDGSPAYARKSLQVSLKNLGVDYIDLYILRSKDPKIPIEESVKAMAVSIVPFASISAQCEHVHL